MPYSVSVTEVGSGSPAGQVLRQYWHPVAISAEIPPGKAMPLRALGEELTLYRGASGQPYLIGARCAHRYTWLHTGWVEGDEIRCFYHGWKYDGSGQCVEQPAEKSSFARRIKIPSYPVREYAGLVFGFMGEGEPPALPMYPELDDPDVKVLAGIRPPGVWPINYFQILENNVDPVHLAFAHRESMSRFREVPEFSVTDTDYGLEVIATRSGRKRRTRYHFPTLMHVPVYLIPNDDTEFHHFFWALPLDETNSIYLSATVIPEDLVHKVPESGLAGRIMPDGAAAELMAGARRPQSVTEEDYVAIVGQGTIADRSNERIGKSDFGINQLRRLWRVAIEKLEPRPPGTISPDRQERRPAVARKE